MPSALTFVTAFGFANSGNPLEYTLLSDGKGDVCSVGMANLGSVYGLWIQGRVNAMIRKAAETNLQVTEE